MTQAYSRLKRLLGDRNITVSELHEAYPAAWDAGQPEKPLPPQP